MKTVLSIFILILLSELSTCRANMCNPRFPIGHYLVHTRMVVHAEIIKIKEHYIQIRIIEDLKSSEFVNKKIKINLTNSVLNSVEISDIFKDDTKYVIFISQLSHFPKGFIYNEPCNRFILRDDSLFIGFEFLKSLNLPDEEIFNQKNTNDDDFMPSGYKISLAYFKEIIEILNATFVKKTDPDYEINDYTRRFLFKPKQTKVTGYTFVEPECNDSFILSIINDLKLKWGFCKEKPVNAID